MGVCGKIDSKFIHVHVHVRTSSDRMPSACTTKGVILHTHVQCPRVMFSLRPHARTRTHDIVRVHVICSECNTATHVARDLARRYTPCKHTCTCVGVMLTQVVLQESSLSRKGLRENAEEVRSPTSAYKILIRISHIYVHVHKQIHKHTNKYNTIQVHNVHMYVQCRCK